MVEIRLLSNSKVEYKLTYYVKPTFKINIKSVQLKGLEQNYTSYSPTLQTGG